jgi:hypothetical protein
MKPTRRLLEIAAELLLLGILIVMVVVLFSVFRNGEQVPVSVSQATSQQQGYPPPSATLPAPATATIPPYPPPATTPAPTLQATSTAQPTSTQKPGPTATGFPLPTPPNNPSGVIRYTTVSGEAPNLIYSHFALRINADTQPQLTVEPEPIPLPELGFSPYQVSLSPNERYLIAMLPVEPGGQPYVVDQTTGQVTTPLSDFAPGQFQGWHPDNRRFLFVVDGGGPWLVDAETLEVNQLVFDGTNHGAAISPDGLTVAYIGTGSSTTSGIHALWLVSSAGGDAAFQFNVGSVAQLYPRAWSPNGLWIVYYGSCSESNQIGPLCLFNSLTGERMTLNIPSFGGAGPAWSPNNQYLAATGYVRGERLCEGDQLSPLEQESCQFDDGHIIYVADIFTNKASQLTSGIAPIWSPDGSMLAFISKRRGAPEIWLIRADGTDLQQLTIDGQYKDPFTLTWSAEVEQ